MDVKRFYVRISDCMGGQEYWLDSEEEVEALLSNVDTIGLSVIALEVNRILYNM